MEKIICDQCNNYEVSPCGCRTKCHAVKKEPFSRMLPYYFEEREAGMKKHCKCFEPIKNRQYTKKVNQEPSERVITTIEENRSNKLCLCSVCGKIARCTPTFDFYSNIDFGENLVCETCFHEYLGHKLNNEKWIASL
jgi:hypothetical protein